MIVLAELLQAAKSQKEVDVLKEFLYVFDFLQESTEMWRKTGNCLIYCVKKERQLDFQAATFK